MFTVFIAHAAPDAAFAQDLRSFLETGCNVSIFHEDGLITEGEDLLSTAENGLSADILLLLISHSSNLPRWVRDIWEPVLSVRAGELGTRVAVVLLEECTIPGLLRRGQHFFDATCDRTAALRRLKRWIWGLNFETEPAMTYSSDLKALYRDLADKVGTATSPPLQALRFAREAKRDFEAVIVAPAHERTLAQICGEAGSQLGLRLVGPVEADCRLVRTVLSERRCLLLLDAPTVAVDALLPSGRTSVLITTSPGMPMNDAPTLAKARQLVSAGRVSEAHEALEHLFRSGVEPEQCARELVWIYEQWDRMEDANRLRFLAEPTPAEQLRLF